jgi:hypothetical protein
VVAVVIAWLDVPAYVPIVPSTLRYLPAATFTFRVVLGCSVSDTQRAPIGDRPSSRLRSAESGTFHERSFRAGMPSPMLLE